MNPLVFVDAAAFAAWLEENHAQEEAIWLKIAKKGSSFATLSLVAKLTASGRMRAPGQAEVDAALADGRWGVESNMIK